MPSLSPVCALDGAATLQAHRQREFMEKKQNELVAKLSDAKLAAVKQQVGDLVQITRRRLRSNNVQPSVSSRIYSLRSTVLGRVCITTHHAVRSIPCRVFPSLPLDRVGDVGVSFGDLRVQRIPFRRHHVLFNSIVYIHVCARVVRSFTASYTMRSSSIRLHDDNVSLRGLRSRRR